VSRKSFIKNMAVVATLAGPILIAGAMRLVSCVVREVCVSNLKTFQTAKDCVVFGVKA